MEFTDAEMDCLLDDDFGGTDAYYLYFGADATEQPVTLQVNFDEAFKYALDNVETTAPSALCKTTDLTQYGIKHDDHIVINSQSYRITGKVNAGDGMTRLLLELSED